MSESGILVMRSLAQYVADEKRHMCRVGAEARLP